MEKYVNPVNTDPNFKVQEPYPFNERGQLRNIVGSKAMSFFTLLKGGIRLTREQKDELMSMLCENSGSPNYRLMGMIIPFEQFMKPYLCEFNDGTLRKVYGFDKTSIRNSQHYMKNCWHFPTK